MAFPAVESYATGLWGLGLVRAPRDAAAEAMEGEYLMLMPWLVAYTVVKWHISESTEPIMVEVCRCQIADDSAKSVFLQWRNNGE